MYFVQHYLICWNNLFPYLHFVIDPSHKLLSVSAFVPTHWYIFLKNHLTKPDMHQNLRCITLNCDSYKFKACDKQNIPWYNVNLFSFSSLCGCIFLLIIRIETRIASKIYRPSPIIWSNIHLIFFSLHILHIL